MIVDRLPDVVGVVATDQHQHDAALLELEYLLLKELERAAGVVWSQVNPALPVFGDDASPEDSVGIQRQHLGRRSASPPYKTSECDPQFAVQCCRIRRPGDDFHIAAASCVDAHLLHESGELQQLHTRDLSDAAMPIRAAPADEFTIAGEKCGNRMRKSTDDQ